MPVYSVPDGSLSTLFMTTVNSEKGVRVFFEAQDFSQFGHTLLQDHLGLVGLFVTKSATACLEDFPQCVQLMLVTELTRPK